MIADAERHFNRVVGVDLGGGKGKHTAVAIGTISPAGLEIQFYGTRNGAGTPFYDRALCELLAKQPDNTLLAMDAPLGLPACVRCTLPECPGFVACADPAVRWMVREGVALERAYRERPPRRKPLITPYTQRVTEILLRCEQSIQPRETLGQGMGPLTARAAHLGRALAPRFSRDESMLEVCPKATIHLLAGEQAAKRYKRGTDTWGVRAALLEQWSRELSFKAWREESLLCDHSFDAVVCAYSGYLWITRGWTRPARFEDIAAVEGWIWYPEPRADE